VCICDLQEGQQVHRPDGRHRWGTSDRRADGIGTHASSWDVAYNAVSPEVYRGFGFPGAEDLGNMFQFNRDFAQAFCGARDLNISRALNPSLQTFDAWLAQNKGRIPLD